MATHPNEWISEEELAKQLGVEREKIRAERPRLGPGEVQQHGRAIVWLRTAAARIATKLGLEFASVKNPPPVPHVVRGLLLEKNPPPGAPEELTVVSSPGPGGWHFANHHLIRARRLNNQTVIVRVVDSRKYVPKLRNGNPMTLKAQPAEAGLWWVPVGREPRYPGAW
jgi:hypothetical protein